MKVFSTIGGLGGTLKELHRSFETREKVARWLCHNRQVNKTYRTLTPGRSWIYTHRQYNYRAVLLLLEDDEEAPA